MEGEILSLTLRGGRWNDFFQINRPLETEEVALIACIVKVAARIGTDGNGRRYSQSEKKADLNEHGLTT